MDKNEIELLTYDEITVKVISSIKDIELFKSLILRWKNLAEGKDSNLAFVLVKNEIYRHFLYKKARAAIRIWEMNNL